MVERESPKLRVASSILASPELSWKCWIKSVFFLAKTFYLLDFYNKKNMVKEIFYLLFSKKMKSDFFAPFTNLYPIQKILVIIWTKQKISKLRKRGC